MTTNNRYALDGFRRLYWRGLWVLASHVLGLWLQERPIGTAAKELQQIAQGHENCQPSEID